MLFDILEYHSVGLPPDNMGELSLQIGFANLVDGQGVRLHKSKFLFINHLGSQRAIRLKKLDKRKREVKVRDYGFTDDYFLFHDELSGGICGDYFINYDKMYLVDASIEKSISGKVCSIKGERVLNVIKSKC